MGRQWERLWRSAVTVVALISAVSAPSLIALSDADPSVINLTDTFEFEPHEVMIHVGDIVEWRNTSRFNHTVTADPTQGHATLPPSAERFSSQELRPGASFRHTFTVPGNYTYFCQPHEGIGMVGQIIVLTK
jgi:plastocyanin